jgi:hypothetical protein
LSALVKVDTCCKLILYEDVCLNNWCYNSLRSHSHHDFIYNCTCIIYNRCCAFERTSSTLIIHLCTIFAQETYTSHLNVDHQRLSIAFLHCCCCRFRFLQPLWHELIAILWSTYLLETAAEILRLQRQVEGAAFRDAELCRTRLYSNSQHVVLSWDVAFISTSFALQFLA